MIVSIKGVSRVFRGTEEPSKIVAVKTIYDAYPRLITIPSFEALGRMIGDFPSIEKFERFVFARATQHHRKNAAVSWETAVWMLSREQVLRNSLQTIGLYQHFPNGQPAIDRIVDMAKQHWDGKFLPVTTKTAQAQTKIPKTRRPER